MVNIDIKAKLDCFRRIINYHSMAFNFFKSHSLLLQHEQFFRILFFIYTNLEDEKIIDL